MEKTGIIIPVFLFPKTAIAQLQKNDNLQKVALP